MLLISYWFFKQFRVVGGSCAGSMSVLFFTAVFASTFGRFGGRFGGHFGRLWEIQIGHLGHMSFDDLCMSF